MTIDEILALYNEGLTLTQIGERFGVDRRVVGKTLRKAGIKKGDRIRMWRE